MLCWGKDLASFFRSESPAPRRVPGTVEGFNEHLLNERESEGRGKCRRAASMLSPQPTSIWGQLRAQNVLAGAEKPFQGCGSKEDIVLGPWSSLPGRKIE